jgi:hypothetical protein
MFGHGLADRNLGDAWMAVKHVKEVVPLGAWNKGSDVLLSWGESLLCGAAMRPVQISVSIENVGNDPAMEAAIREWAAKARATGCGNCGEQASLAFLYLLERHVRPLDFMACADGDHNFVVIGRPAAVPASDFKRWGQQAVVCDPWDGTVYFAAYGLPVKMPNRLEKYVSLFRVE